MDPVALSPDQDLERFRGYLHFFVRTKVDPRLQAKIDPSGIVQQTFLEAHQALSGFQGQTEEQKMAWLRRILANNLADEIRKLQTGKRELGRERSLEGALEQSASRLEVWLQADQSSPSQKAEHHENELKLADALARLPEGQREALMLQHWQGWTVAEIGNHMGRSPEAVAGLIKRGLKQLRQMLREPE
jgi:RNA polymerase sigma-70 factor (ECF subfamily)